MTRKLSRRITGCAVAIGLALSLVSCTKTDPDGPTTDLPGESDLVLASDSPELDAITVTGVEGQKPGVTVEAPWSTKTTSARILVEGEGMTVTPRGLVQANYVGVNARTGEVFDSSWEQESPPTFVLAGGVVPGFQKGLAGKKVGSRVLIAMTGADGYDGSGGKEEAGIEYGDTLIFVVDITNTQADSPMGETVTDPAEGLPQVSGDLDQPVVTIPSGEPPEGLVVQPLIIGPGPEVTIMDLVTVHYTEYIWAGGTFVRQTYGYAPVSSYLMNAIPGWQRALQGQTTGSRVLLVVPPEQAYPQGNPKLGVPEGSTMVYVVDILYAAAS